LHGIALHVIANAFLRQAGTELIDHLLGAHDTGDFTVSRSG
jgi:hypothetical protein